jgi:DNA-binding transcriptional LysR family regulator
VELIKAIEAHRLDGAFVGGFHQNSALSQEEVFSEELVLVSSNHFETLPALIEKCPSKRCWCSAPAASIARP